MAATSQTSLLEPGQRLPGGLLVGQRAPSEGIIQQYRATRGAMPVDLQFFAYDGIDPLSQFSERFHKMISRRRLAQHGHLTPVLGGGRLIKTTGFWIAEQASRSPTLAERLQERRRLAPDQAQDLAIQVVYALILLHEHEVVHGAVDPDHIRLRPPDDYVLLSGAGLASTLQATGMMLGASHAPECLGGAPASVASDLWQVGALLHLMLTGQPPRPGRRPPSGISPGLAKAIRRCLQEQPGARPADAAELLELLQTTQEESPRVVSAPPTASFPRTVTPMGAIRRPTPPTVPKRLHRTPPPPQPPSNLKGASIVPAVERRPRKLPTRVSPRSPQHGLMIALLGAGALMVLVLPAAYGTWRLFGAPSIPPPVAAVVLPSDPAPVPPPASTVVTLVSTPPRAEVWEHGERIGQTPMEILIEDNPVAPAREFELRLEGYAPHIVRQAYTATAATHSIAMQPLPAIKPARPAPKPRPKPSPDMGVVNER